MARAPFELVWKIYYYIDIVEGDKNEPVEPSYFEFDDNQAKAYFTLSGDNTTEVIRSISRREYQLRLFNSGTTTGDTVMYFPWMTQADIDGLRRNNYAATGETIIETSVSAEGYFTKKNHTEHDEAPEMVWSCYYTMFENEPKKNNEIEIKTPDTNIVKMQKYPSVMFVFVDSNMSIVSNVSYIYNTSNAGSLPVTGNTGNLSYVNNVPGNVIFVRYGRLGFLETQRQLSFFDPNSVNYVANPVVYLVLPSNGEIASNYILDTLFGTSLVNTYSLPYNENYSNYQKQITPNPIGNAFNQYTFSYSTIAENNPQMTLRVSDYRTNSLPTELEQQLEEFNSHGFTNTGMLTVPAWTGSGRTLFMYCPAMSSYTPNGYINTPIYGVPTIQTDVWDDNNPQTYYSSTTAYTAPHVLMRFWYYRPDSPSTYGKNVITTISGTLCTITGITANNFGVFSPKINLTVSGWMTSTFHSTATTNASCCITLKDLTNNNDIHSETFPITGCGTSFSCGLNDVPNNGSGAKYCQDQYTAHILSGTSLSSSRTYAITFELSAIATITNKTCCDRNASQYWSMGYFTCAITEAYVSINAQEIMYGYN